MILHKLSATLWKCLKIRQRHYMITIFVFLIPIVLYGLLAWSRSKIGDISKQYVNETTYVDPMSEDELYQRYKVDVGRTYLLYAPATAFTNALMLTVQHKMQILNEKFYEFNSDEDLLTFYNKNTTDENNVFAVIFDGLKHDEIPEQLTYSIRNFEKNLDWQTDMKFNIFSSHYIPDTGSEKYFHKGFLNLQLAVDKTYMEMKKGSNLDIELSMQEFPYPPHFNDMGFIDLFMTFLPLVTLFSTIFIFPGTLKRMMEEKESGIKELMKMMGLPPSIMYIGWFIDALFPVLLSSVICTAFMKVTWGTAYAPIDYCNGVIYGIFLLLYFSSCVAFCLFVSAVSDSPSITTTFSILAWIITYILPFSISGLSKLGFAINIILCIIPNFAMYYGFQAISFFEIRGIGVQWNNLFINASGSTNNIPMGFAMIMLFIDVILLLLLGFYFEQIFPGKYGLPKPWNYPLMNLSKWLSRKSPIKRRNSRVGLTSNNDDVVKIEECCLTPGIVIDNMTKTYGDITAVHNMSVKFYEGEIAVLLGRNGAGKTTTMSVITGLTNATHGKIWINGYDICENLSYVRSVMGICPQHDLFFPELTVFENVMFFAKLHNVSSANKTVNNLLQEVGIFEQKSKFPHQISGGMKRKLCLAMAIISNPQVLIMDEPTSGLDPKSRRDIWDLILKWRSDKPRSTIMVSTHFMEEADVLGDRITIIESGRLVAQGSPMYLKKEFGNEYSLTLILNDGVDDSLLKDDYFKYFKRPANIIKKDKSYTINLTNEDKTNLIGFLELLEQKQYVKYAGISITTIEDVFLKLATSPSLDHNDENTCHISLGGSSNGEATRQRKLFSVWMHRYGGLFYQYRRYLPFFLMACAMMILLSNVGSTESVDRPSHPELKLQLSSYGKTEVFYSVQNGIDDAISQEFSRLVLAQGCTPRRVRSVSDALINLGIKSLDDYKQKEVVAMEFNHTNDNKVLINMMYSNLALHGAPIILNLAMNAVAKSMDSAGINTANVPLQSNSDIIINEMASEIQIVLLWVILAPIALLFLVSSYIDYPLKERISSFKHLIYMSGVTPMKYWFEMFVFHFALLYIPAALTLFIILLFNKLYHHGSSAILVLLICYGIMMIPFVFIFSYKKSVASAVGSLSILTLFTGLVFPFVIAILKNCGDDFYEELGSVLHVISHFSPQYWLANNLITFSRKSVSLYKWDNMLPSQKEVTCKITLNPCCPINGVVNIASCNEYKSFFVDDMTAVKLILVTLALFTFYLAILCVLDSLKAKRIYDNAKKKIKSYYKSDIMEVDNGTSDDNDTGFTVKHLTKNFAGKDVVKDLSFHVKYRECYGLLGVNGAGKTTTFQMLTGYEIPTHGSAFIKKSRNSPEIRLDILQNMNEYFKEIGYCPQFNAINEVLSARTLLLLFANLRRIPKEEQEYEVTNMLNELTLQDFANVPCGTLSGGNKRKLSLGLALIGKPSVGFLDEPTTGVDPVSRRKIWDVINKMKQAEDCQPLVLTSHSMDECEILCDRLAIMRKGDVHLDGSINELKALYAQGYTIKIKLNYCRNIGMYEDVDEVDSGPDLEYIFPTLIKEKMPFGDLKIEVKDKHEGLLHYFVASNRCGVEDLKVFFQVMEEIKKNNSNVEDYTINTSTLEDVFLAVARQSENERD